MHTIMLQGLLLWNFPYLKMEAEKSKKVIIGIFLVGIFVILTMYIGGWITDIYRETTTYTNESTKTTVDCIGYVFRLRDISYQNGELSFEIENQRFGDHVIESIIISSGGVQEEVTTGYLEQGRSTSISLTIPIEENFTVYPPGCEVYQESFTLP